MPEKDLEKGVESDDDTELPEVEIEKGVFE